MRGERLTQALLVVIALLLLVLVMREDRIEIDPVRFDGNPAIHLDPDMRAILEQIRDTVLEIKGHAQQIELEVKNRR